jgi:hypothetical protein
MVERLDAIFAIVEEIEPRGVRQAFYQTVARGLMDRTDADYDKVQRALVAMRRAGRVPYGWIVDGTRWMRKPRSFLSLEQAVQQTAESYRRAVWDDQPVRVEIWLEKAAAGRRDPRCHSRIRCAVRVARILQPDLSGRGLRGNRDLRQAGLHLPSR